MRTSLRWYVMSYRTHYATSRGTHKARHRAAGSERALATRRRGGLTVLAATAGLAVLAVGCGGPAAPSSVGSASSPHGNPHRYQGLVSPPNEPAGTGSPHGNQGFVGPSEESAGTGSRSGVVGGALFGGTAQLAEQEGKLGRRLAIVRVYYTLGESFPTPASKHLMESGSTLLVSLDTLPSRGPSYASIIAGHEDAEISAFLRAMNRAAVRYHLGAIYICFEHEADNPPRLALGSPAEFVRAWDHVHQLGQSEHLNWNTGGRLHWVLILQHTVYFRVLPRWERKDGGGASAFWPGAGEVDIVAADGYNHMGCKNNAYSVPAGGASGSLAVSPGELFDPVLSFAHSHGGLPVFIAEWGTQGGYAAGQQPAFIAQMKAYVSANREIAAAMYFDWRNAKGLACTSIINNHPASLSAMAAMGHSAGLQGRLVAPA
jgi:hypothetical protein